MRIEIASSQLCLLRCSGPIRLMGGAGLSVCGGHAECWGLIRMTPDPAVVPSVPLSEAQSHAGG